MIDALWIVFHAGVVYCLQDETESRSVQDSLQRLARKIIYFAQLAIMPNISHNYHHVITPKPSLFSVSPSISFHFQSRSVLTVVLIIMRHFQSRPLESTFDIESLVRFRAIENTLIAPHIHSNEIKGLNYFQPELLPLLILRDRDVFDVSYNAEVVDAILSYQPGSIRK
jgi:hypothetical protein